MTAANVVSLRDVNTGLTASFVMTGSMNTPTHVQRAVKNTHRLYGTDRGRQGELSVSLVTIITMATGASNKYFVFQTYISIP